MAEAKPKIVYPPVGTAEFAAGTAEMVALAEHLFDQLDSVIGQFGKDRNVDAREGVPAVALVGMSFLVRFLLAHAVASGKTFDPADFTETCRQMALFYNTPSTLKTLEHARTFFVGGNETVN